MFGLKKLKRENKRLKDYIDSYKKMMDQYVLKPVPICSLKAQIEIQGEDLLQQDTINRILIDQLCIELGKPQNIQQYLQIKKEVTSLGTVYIAEIKVIPK